MWDRRSYIAGRVLLTALTVLFSSLAGAQVKQEAMRALVSSLSPTPQGLGVPCTDRVAWSGLRGRFSLQIQQAEQYKKQPIPPWSDSTYLEFSHDGQRVAGESMMLGRQEELNTIVMAECAEGSGRFLPKTIELLDALATQRSWVYPAADPKLDDFYGRGTIIDLNAAAVADELAQSLYLLSVGIPQPVQQHVRDALEKRIFTPMRFAYRNGGGPSWLTMRSNWNAVCLDGVTGAALSILPSPEDRALFVAGAEQFYVSYLQGFPSDGYATEGIGYWNYGMNSFLELAARLFQATHGHANLFTNPAVRGIADFGVEIQMLPGVSAALGDAQFMTHANPQLLNYLEYALGLPGGAGQQPADPRSLPAVGIVSLDSLTSFPFRLTNQQASSKGDALPLRTYFPVSKVLVSRPSGAGTFAMTFKAGGASGHGHNDLGSFTIAYKGQVPLGDPGGPKFYTAESFSSHRDDSPLISSYGHALPMIDGRLEKDADTLNLPVLASSFAPSVDSITVDLTSAYQTPALKRYTRTLKYSREALGSVEVIDTFELNSPMDVDEALPTHGSWQPSGDQAARFALGSSALLVSVEGPSPSVISADKVDQFGNAFTRVHALVHLTSSGVVKLHIEPVN